MPTAEYHKLDKDSINEPSDVEHTGTSTISKATFNMTKTIVGAGVFGFPKLYQNAGFFTVSILVIAMAIVIAWTLMVLLKAGMKARKSSYHSLMHHCFGNFGSILYALFSFLFAFGGMAAYTVIIGDTVPIIVRSMLGVASETVELSTPLKILTDRRVIIACTSYFVMLPISSFRDITKLARFSIFALFAIILIALIVIVNAPEPVPGQIFTVFNPNGLLGAVGTLCFAYVCHHNTFIIYNSLQVRTFGNFKRVISYSLIYAMITSLLIGISGFIIFKHETTSNILNVFSNTDTMANVARALFAIDMFLTYPLELFIARNTIFKVFFDENVTISKHLLITLILVTSTTIIGIFTCNLGMVFDITGGIAASAIAFIFPSACMIILGGKPFITMANLPHITCVMFGIAVLVLTTYKAILESFDTTDSICKFKNF